MIDAFIWSTKIYISVFTDSYGSGIFVDTVICKMSRGVKHAKTDQININKIKKRF